MSALLQDDPARTADYGYFSWERKPQPSRREIEADIARGLRHAVIAQHQVSWGTDRYCEAAAEALYSCADKDAEAVFAELQTAIAKGASDADVAALSRHWHRLAFERAIEQLADCAESDQDITFPEQR